MFYFKQIKLHIFLSHQGVVSVTNKMSKIIQVQINAEYILFKTCILRAIKFLNIAFLLQMFPQIKPIVAVATY
jgi:hypothetical protein